MNGASSFTLKFRENIRNSTKWSLKCSSRFLQAAALDAPITTFSKRKIKQFSKPWITKELRTSIRTKNRLYQSDDIEKYKYHRNKICTLTRLSKKSYYHEFFRNNLNDMRKTWQAINALLNRWRRSSKPINKLKAPQINNNIVNDPSRIPSMINKYFSSVGID